MSGTSRIPAIKSDLGGKAMHRKIAGARQTYSLRERSVSYRRKFPREVESLRPENMVSWQEIHVSTET